MNQSWITNSVTFFYLQVLQNNAMILNISVKMKKSLQKTASQKDKKTDMANGRNQKDKIKSNYTANKLYSDCEKNH
jgi:hypothetical protein